MYIYIMRIYIIQNVFIKKSQAFPPKTKKKKTITQTTPHLHKDALLQGMCQKGAIDQHMVRLLVQDGHTKLTVGETNHGKEYPPGN